MKPKPEPSYHRITWTLRLKIEALFNAGHSRRFIAFELGYSPAGMGREIKRGLYDHLDGETWKTVKRYSADIAQQDADSQATAKGPEIKLGKRYDYANHVKNQIKAGKSPDAIVNSLKKNNQWTVSTTTLYRYIENGYIPGVTSKNLMEKPARKPSNKDKEQKRAVRASKGTSIEQRPREVSTRQTFGHWEQDSVIGKAKGTNESLLVLTERKTRFEIILRSFGKTSAATVHALNALIPMFPKGTFQTITVDNGSEFQDCHGMEYDQQGNKRLTVYYCHPFSSCERGSNERNNRIIRRYLPKGQSLKHVTQAECNQIAAAINDMPRKILNYSTARELFEQELAALTAAQSVSPASCPS